MANPSKWTPESIHKEALRYSTRSAFSKGSRGAYQAAQQNGWLDEVCAHMQSKPKTKWTYEAIKNEALNYETRSAFQKGNAGAYHAARRRGWLDEVCAHMQKLIHCTEQKTD